MGAGGTDISRNNSMGLVRYYLALMVILSHFNLTFGTDFPVPTSSYNAVGGFFALSGFLVYRSWLHSGGFRPYILRRMRRIIPSYSFIILLAAFGLVAVSTLSWQDYFLNPGWLKYVVCNLLFMNFLAPDLPGVFQNMPVHAVNGSLWTIKIEIMLYLSIPLFSWVLVRLHRRMGRSLKGTIALIAGIYVFSMLYRLLFSHLYAATGKEVYNILSRQVFGQLMYFYVGVLIYFTYSFFMKHRVKLLLLALALMLACSWMDCYLIVFSPMVVGVCTLFFSLISDVRILSVFNTDNVSYDMYLFHFPVLLLLGQYEFFHALAPLCQLAVAIGITALLSFFSWFAIGKRFLHGHRTMCR